MGGPMSYGQLAFEDAAAKGIGDESGQNIGEYEQKRMHDLNYAVGLNESLYSTLP